MNMSRNSLIASLRDSKRSALSRSCVATFACHVATPAPSSSAATVAAAKVVGSLFRPTNLRTRYSAL